MDGKELIGKNVLGRSVTLDNLCATRFKFWIGLSIASCGLADSNSAVQVDNSLNPANVIGNFGVDSVFATFTAALAETGDTENGPAIANLTQKWAPRIAGARVNATLAVARAEPINKHINVTFN